MKQGKESVKTRVCIATRAIYLELVKNIFQEKFLAAHRRFIARRGKPDQIICGALCDLVPFLQFKKCEKHPWRSVNFSKVAGFSLKLTFLHGCFSRILNCTNGTKSRNAPHIKVTKLLLKLPENIF